MQIRHVKQRSRDYFEDRPDEDVTLAGFTRALKFKEGDIELLMDDQDGRGILLAVYLELAEKMETAANRRPSSHRTEMLKGLNKFVGGLYTYEKAAKEQYINAKTSFAEIDQRSQQRLMKAIANRNNKTNDTTNRES